MRLVTLGAVLVTAVAWSAAAMPAQGGPSGPVGAFRPRAGLRDGPAQRDCQAEARQVVDPDVVALGGRVTVTLTLEADCSAVQIPVHVALVFDNSVAMAGTRMNYMKMAVRAFVDVLDFSVARVGLARYSLTGEVLSPLTADPDEVAAAAQRFFPRLGSNLTMGIRAGQGLLEAGADLAVVPNPEQVMILLVGSANDGGPDEALEEARLAKAAGTTVVTIGAGLDADVEMLEAMASSASLFYTEGTSSRFPSLFQQIARDLGTVRPTAATVTNTLPAAFDYVFGSGFPVPRMGGDGLVWQFGVWPPAGLVIEYQLEAKALGRHRVSTGAAADLVLDRGPVQRVVFPVPEVEVVTALTMTPPPSTATPGPTPTPHLRHVYLPFLVRSHCVVPGPPGDVVFAMDTSASMLDPVPAGGVKMDHALRAAAAFSDSLRYPQERAAVVVFGDRAVVLQGLAGSRGPVVSALGRMYGHLGRTSRLAPGLDAAGRLLAPAAAPGDRQRLVVVVTDGVSDAEAAWSTALRLRSSGVEVAVVALGGDVPRDWPGRLASRSSLAAHVDAAPDLDAALWGFRRQLRCGLD